MQNIKIAAERERDAGGLGVGGFEELMQGALLPIVLAAYEPLELGYVVKVLQPSEVRVHDLSRYCFLWLLMECFEFVIQGFLHGLY